MYAALLMGDYYYYYYYYYTHTHTQVSSTERFLTGVPLAEAPNLFLPSTGTTPTETQPTEESLTDIHSAETPLTKVSMFSTILSQLCISPHAV